MSRKIETIHNNMREKDRMGNEINTVKIPQSFFLGGGKAGEGSVCIQPERTDAKGEVREARKIYVRPSRESQIKSLMRGVNDNQLRELLETEHERGGGVRNVELIYAKVVQDSKIVEAIFNDAYLCEIYGDTFKAEGAHFMRAEHLAQSVDGLISEQLMKSFSEGGSKGVSLWEKATKKVEAFLSSELEKADDDFLQVVKDFVEITEELPTKKAVREDWVKYKGARERDLNKFNRTVKKLGFDFLPIGARGSSL